MSLQVQLESPIRRVQDSAGNKLVGPLIQAPAGYIADDKRTSVIAASRDVSRNLTGSMDELNISVYRVDETCRHTIAE